MENTRGAEAPTSRIRVSGKVKTFVLDTNVLLHDPQSIFKFEDNNLAIPVEVLEELDAIKGEQSTERGRSARRVHRILQELPPASLATYPEAGEIYRKLGRWAGVDPANLLLTPGSDGAIRLAFDAFVEPGDDVIHTEPTFAMYPVYSLMFGAQALRVEYARGDRGPLGVALRKVGVDLLFLRVDDLADNFAKICGGTQEAKLGAQDNVTTAGVFDLDTDSNGRWSVEKFKGLMFQLEREANRIARETRRGKGNVILCSSDVASALQMAGVLDYTPALNSNNLQVDDTGNTFAGVLNGRFRVYIDPYAIGGNYFTVGYKGSSAFDAGLFYCPYVPLQMVRAVDQSTFQPKIGFKTRYGIVANPFAEGLTKAAGALDVNSNVYYRKVIVNNLM